MVKNIALVFQQNSGKTLFIMKPVVTFLNDEQLVSMQYARGKEDRQRALR